MAARRRRGQPAIPNPPAKEPSLGRLWLGLAGLVVLAVVVSFAWQRWSGGRPASLPGPDSVTAVIPDQAATYALYAGSTTCRECHEQAYAEWMASNHGLAERELSATEDRPAFDPPKTFEHASQTTEARYVNGRYELATLGFGTNREPYQAVRVIGNTPLRQFLIERPGGRLQVSEACWDPLTNEWFNVYGAEDRMPGEWGHWTGRGMGWNAMCAGCHNTRVRKNYDAGTDTYATSMTELTVSCEACHGPMKDHVVWQRTYRNSGQPYPPAVELDPTLTRFSTNQVLSMCGSCHARRGDLTGDFRPYDDFFDHYSLTIPDETDIYYPDGQVREEDYEFAAFLGSRMHLRGVYCLDCHTPHAAKPAIQGNDLCLRCHNGSRTDSPVIDPVAHGFHGGYKDGNDCTDCHMPVTAYMQRHWRHDHGFTIPDPLLTKQFNIPNACNRCHQDKDADWALEWTDKWYGEKMNRRTRTRATWLARARDRDPAARDPLLDLLADEEIPYWRASIISLLGQWIQEPTVRDAVSRELEAADPTVREKAIHALEPWLEMPGFDVRPAFRRLLDDSVRCVRVAAAWALRGEVAPASQAGRELLHMMDFNADQPTGQLQKAVYALARGDTDRAYEHLRRSIAWDPNSAPLRHEMAVVCSMTGRLRDAVDQLTEACRLAPTEAEYRYKLALAWNEMGNLSPTIQNLEAAVEINPRHARAWYNLGLARNQDGQPQPAIEALLRAEAVSPEDARIPYARATILAQAGRIEEARIAAGRALEIERDFAAARQLLESLR
ncbi:MAG: HEAT repeat domain-containing protein [Verrucomicrobiales bacterium]|nr:HEAT repeat domain-containing protein [Verrucomicrobiales bacterium]